VLQTLAVVLAVTGAALLASEVFVSHPEAARFLSEGRHLSGDVLPESRGRGPGTRWTRISVDDPELGAQLIQVPGYVPTGSLVPVLCLTPAPHCMRAKVSAARLAA
jgi:hypothetical protein